MDRALAEGPSRCDVSPMTELDRAFAHELAAVVADATRSFDEHELAAALERTEDFFWRWFTDAYLELTEARARGDGGSGEAARGSAVAALRLGLSVLLRLFAPMLPYITDEVWRWVYADETGQASSHRATWPAAADFAEVAAPADPGLLDLAAAMAAVNKRRSELGQYGGRRVGAG
ncbi:class I tRNA ligase family protein [Sorangium sp. So ce1151]|uniref:class I tRNA ligase family protein n=1 Tax=Sorangium sp. So ce1151 TaxID=3133332 RepID=UPI003F64852B